MSIDVSDENVLGRFDKLTQMGIIHYGPSKAVALVDRDFPFEFRVCQHWSAKPLTANDKTSTNSTQPHHRGLPERFGPDSDIDKSHPDQVIGTINSTHVLALNIYPAFRPQFLLLTLESSRLQSEPLDLGDIEAAWKVLSSLETPHYVVYNCAEPSGCSRNHKHMQILKKPEGLEGPDATSFRFFPDVRDRQITVPYVYFLHRFDSSIGSQRVESQMVFEIYLKLLQQCRKALGISQEDLCPHNLIMVKDWILIIPRVRSTYKGVMANAASMMGMCMMSNHDLYKIWMNEGPAKALGQFGISSSDA